MPLIQWIMQNLNQTQQQTGVVVGGTSSVYKKIFVDANGGVLVNGSANVDKRVFKLSGGVVLSGTALVERRANKRRRIKYNIGQTIYDKNGNPWIVSGFKYIYPGEPVYSVFNGYKNQIFKESMLFPSQQPKIKNPDRELNCLKNTPNHNYPIYTGVRKVKL